MHQIRTEQDVTGEAAKALRESCGLSQKAFWSVVGLTQSGGCRYERGNRLPKPIRILLFITYVAELKIDASTPTGAADIRRLAQLQASESAPSAETIGAALITAKGHIRRASNALANIS
jgi:transcriptional regulator with XRE-family HTH domain